ncbi:cytochrome c biogenesis protein CcsA [Paraconexibacter antarcticus]|uniref:Cytochrome c biogenesis protein CcsA n=1 Tax=Paraconexibacter antarcticus TaxID=2949664 RepID=A0ABY5DQR2_9ACTN|nr:cytochrome c-type biogenesis CcmF C-terminal domain-containing protein [Paraconexibacter antarcticus]UTI64001.1 cytochrome c biogenesis protein CcsA [Paraconexibacter antarcticus]
MILAFAVAVYGVGAAVYAGRCQDRNWAASARRSVYALAGLATFAFLVLELAFLRSDFTFAVVASHSSTTTPTGYKAAAAWSSQEGSLLLWLWLLSLWSSLVLYLTRNRMRDVTPYATAVLCIFGAFFAGLLVFAASPFQTLAVAPTEGSGLSPLLRHPVMMIHPPMLYSGYTLFTVPFAFAVAALLVRRVDAEWITATRRFALAAWFFLGIGIVLGARWSYSELGWGGYWAWDPVENASLLPWLTGTAFLHSLMIQERRGMLKIWNASLILATGTLAIMGTFLVRSGILDSIHAFGASTLGTPFVIFIGVLICGSIGLVVSRRESLRSENRLDSLLSRESVFIANNLVLVGLAFVTFWGTFFPLISEAVTGTKSAVGPPWFDRYTVPLALALVLLSGIGPVIAWRRATAVNARRNFLAPAVGSVAVVVLLALVADAASRPKALAMFFCAAFVFITVGQEFARGVRARRAMSGGSVPGAFFAMIGRNRRRYGGYIAHVGFATVLVGVAASSAFQHAKDVQLVPGQTASNGGYEIHYQRATGRIVTSAGRLERLEFGAVMRVTKGGRYVATLRPNRGFYPVNAPFVPISSAFDGEATSEVGLKAGLRRDIWMAIQPDLTPLRPYIKQSDKTLNAAVQRAVSVNPAHYGQVRRAIFAEIIRRYVTHPPAATFRLIVSPMVMWIWIGTFITFGGGLVAMWPAPDGVRRRARGRYAARVVRDLGRA